MKRRTLLKGVIGGTAIGFAGCLNQGSDIDGGGDTTDPDKTGRNNGKTGERDSDSGGGGNNENSGGEGTDTSNDGSDGSNDQTDDGSGDSTDETTTAKPALVNSSFEIVSAGCGTNSGTINTSFTDHTVRVTGSIRGENSCYTAELTNTSFKQGTLTVTVRSFETESSDVCAMCLKNIEYESIHTFEGGLPKQVVIIHNDTRMTSMKRKSQ
jgi:hypothetical protein